MFEIPPITFFGRQGAHGASTWLRLLGDDGRSVQTHLLARPAVGGGRRDDRNAPPERDGGHEAARERVEQRLWKAGGGWFAQLSDDGKGPEATVDLQWSGGGPTPEVLHIRPGRRPVFEKAAAIDTLGPGEHLLVPVDPQAAERLAHFVGHLDELPGGTAALMLDVLRNPDLESRLGRLEREVARTRGRMYRVGGLSRLAGPWRDWRLLPRRIRWATTAATILVLLSAGLWALWPSSVTESEESRKVQPRWCWLGDWLPRCDDAAKLWDQSLPAFLQSFERAAVVDPNYFRSKSELELKKSFDNEEDYSEAEKEALSSSAWAIVPIQALALLDESPRGRAAQLLRQAVNNLEYSSRDWAQRVATKRVLRVIDPHLSRDQRMALAAVFCDQFGGAEPALPEVTGDTVPGRVVLTGVDSCEEIDRPAALRGLQALEAWVRRSRGET